MQQHTDHFVGRAEEIETFMHWLADPDAPWIFYIHDAAEEADKKGGVGKTRLIRRCANLVRQARQDTVVVMADFFNIGDRDRLFLSEKIVVGVQELYPAWKPTSFTEAIRQYRVEESLGALAGSGESMGVQIRELASAALVEDLHRLNTYLAEEQRTLLVFLDTFEAIEQNVGIAVLRQAQKFPDNYQFENMRVVIAGRNRLDWTQPNWEGREQEVQVMALKPFSEQEMLEYVESESVYEISAQATQVGALYERTEGRPIIIGLTIDVLNNRILTLQELIAVSKAEFERYLVPQVNNLENPLNWIILFMAHVYHRFNMPILEWILDNVSLSEPAQLVSHEELTRRLPELSFVRRPGSGDDFVLHDEMRRLVTKYCWEVQDTDRRFRKDISRSIISYYEREMKGVLNEQQRQGYIVEMLYHRLFMDLNEGLLYFRQEFLTSLRFSRNALSRLLLQEVQRFMPMLSSAQLNGVQYAEAEMLRAEENPRESLSILLRLERGADADWYAEWEPSVLIEEGRCYFQQSKLLESASCYTRALSIEQQRGREMQSALLLRNLGRIYRRRGQFSQALDYYERCIAIYKRLGRQSHYAGALTQVGLVYRSQGKTEEALRRCKVAWRLRLELFRAGSISEIAVGLSLHALGQIYLDDGNIIEAEHNFQEAFDIFLRSSYKGGIAIIYSRFGHVQLLKGDLEGAREWFVKAQHASEEIEREQYINSLNKQGRICVLQHKWEAAVSFFEHAISVAEPVPDYYQQTESLIDLADALEHLRQDDRVQQVLGAAEEIAIRESYSLLLGFIERARGNIHYRAREYEEAFQHFARYCHHMAMYNSSEFGVAVQKVVDALLGVPGDTVPTLVQKLLSYWTEHQLDKDYPKLIQAFEEIDALMVM